MRRKYFLALVIALLAITALMSRVVWADDPPTSSVYDGVGEEEPVQNPSPIPCAGGETVLLIQDNVPWFASPDPLGPVVAELKAQNKDFCIANSADIGLIALGAFSEIEISSAQTQTFYNTLFPNGVIHPAITEFVENGGILSANLADCASGPGAGGTWATQGCGANEATSYTFVGGVKHVNFFDQQNNIAAPGHPVIADTLPCPSGNCTQIVDGPGVRDDLDGWNWDSHGYFINLPGGTTTIIVDSQDRPVFVEYPFGAGLVIAGLTTTEWRYVASGGNKKLLANEIAYQDARIVVPIDIKPGTDPNSINCNNEKGVIPVAILTTDDFDATTVDHTTVTFEGASEIHVDKKSGEPRRHEEDVDGDGDIDLVFHFRLGDTDLTCDSTEGTLIGETSDGLLIVGTDTVRMVDKGGGKP